MYRFIRKATKDDSGIAMLVVIGVMSVVTLLAVGSFSLARQSLHDSERIEEDSRAFRAAAGGLERGLATFDDSGGAISEGLLFDGDTPDGSYEVYVESLGGGRFRLESHGEGLDGGTETVAQEFFYLNLWEMNLAGNGPQSLISGSSGLNGTSNIIGPFYMKGNFDIQANMGVFEGPLFVKDGNISAHRNSWLGTESQSIDVFCDGDGDPSVPANADYGGGRGVYVANISRSVPNIILPPLVQGDLEGWANKALHESVDNILGTINMDASLNTANLEHAGGAGTYTTMSPPNNAGFTRKKATATNDFNPHYKFFGALHGGISSKGEGSTHLTIGGSSFGAWGAVSTSDGVNLPAGPSGSTGYPANSYDDFAYDSANGVLYISGTVFVDGPVTFTEDMTYIGNGTIIANGEVNINGILRPYSTNDSHGSANSQGENNKWALGIVTPRDIYFYGAGSNDYNTLDREELRTATPIYAGAFYAENDAVFATNNLSVRGTILSGRMDFPHSNQYLITNPLLPSYIPDSLPGGSGGILIPGLWVRN